MSLDHKIEANFDISDEHLLISIPLTAIAAEAEASEFPPVRVRDVKEFSSYLVRYLEKPLLSDDVGELVENAIGHILKDVAYLGEGVISILEEIPLLIDRMWMADGRKILTYYGNAPLNKTPRECVEEAIRAVWRCDRVAALEWLVRGQDLNDPVANALEANWSEALEYAVTRYGPELKNCGERTELL